MVTEKTMRNKYGRNWKAVHIGTERNGVCVRLLCSSMYGGGGSIFYESENYFRPLFAGKYLASHFLNVSLYDS